MLYIKKPKMLIGLIIFVVLFMVSSQKFNKELEQKDLSFYFPNITNTTKEIDILCYDEICYGILNKNQINTFINLTVICNNSSCIIKNEEFKEKYQNCTEMILTCFRNKCIGGPIDDNPIIDDGGNKSNLKWIIIISCLWVILIIIDIILIFQCKICFSNFKCGTKIFLVIIFAPVIFIFILFDIIRIILIFIFCCECASSSKPKIKGEYKKIEEKKEKIIQRHSYFGDIKKIKGELYLVNHEEVRITLMLCHSLKMISQNISVYTFNIAQVELLKEQFKEELSFINIILLNENCTNFIYSDYIIINYIESPISKELREKYFYFNSNLNSKKYFTEDFTNKVLEKYTKNKLYLICNFDYLTQEIDNSNDNIINNSLENSESNVNLIVPENKSIPLGKVSNELIVREINRDYVSNEYNVCFIIDNTGSMEHWINIIKNICINLFIEIVKKFDKYIFSFGFVLYGDKPSVETDQNFALNFTNNEEEFKTKLEEVKLQSGGDGAEDWVSGFKLALEELKWGNGTKLIFHIADAPAHGKTFNINKRDDNFLEEENDEHGQNLIELIKECSNRNIKIIGINIDNVSSFKVFKEQYENYKGPKYEIININGSELREGDNYINKKMFEIIEQNINASKASKFLK